MYFFHSILPIILNYFINFKFIFANFNFIFLDIINPKNFHFSDHYFLSIILDFNFLDFITILIVIYFIFITLIFFDFIQYNLIHFIYH